MDGQPGDRPRRFDPDQPAGQRHACASLRPAARARSGGARGLSIIEILVVVAILGTLLAVGSPMYGRARDKAMVVRAIADIASIQKDLAVFTLDTGALPASLAELPVTAPSDPWGQAYEYLRFIDSKNAKKDPKADEKMRRDVHLKPLNTDYDLYSMGKDRQSKPNLANKASQDDVLRAINGGFIGLAVDF
jgi:general secretion pathway protein G